MRTMKRTVSVLLSLMLVLGMMTIGMSVASAAETKVTATSNIGATASAAYTADSEQVTVTYKLNTAATISGVRAVITYDKAVLKLATTNTAATCFPTLNESLVANLTKTDGRLPFNASSYNGYNFAGGAVLATVVFDIIGTGNTTVDLEVKDLISVTNAPSQTDADEVVIIDDATNDTSKYTATAEVTVSPSGIDPSVFIQDVRIALEGKIGLNFYFYNAPQGYDASKISVKFSGPVEDYDKTVKLTDLQAGKRQGVNIRRNDYYVYAAMMTDTVKAEIFYDGELVSTYTTTVAQWVTTHMPEFASNTKGVRLLKTMLNYGASSQNFFAYKTDDLANKDNDLALEKITADTIQVPAGVGDAPNLSGMGANFSRCSAELKEATALRVYMTVTDASKFANASVTVDGNKLPYLASGSTRAAVLENIPAAYYDTVYTFNFSNGATYKQSVMNYVKGVISAQSGNEVVENLVSSIYWYNQAANDFFGA